MLDSASSSRGYPPGKRQVIVLQRFAYYFFSLLFLGSMAVLAGYMIFPERSQEFCWSARRAGHEFLYGKSIRYLGLSILQSEDIEVRLPMSRSVAWWLLNTSSIEASLRSHPLIQEAYVQPCERFAIHCFDVIVVERRPQYLVQIGGETWAVGEDGGFITPTPGSEKLPNTIRLEGLGGAGSSPDAVRAQFQQVKKAIAVIEGQAGLPVSMVMLDPNLEFSVAFKDLPFMVRFDLANEGGAIPLESRRLKKLLLEFAGRLEVIKSIDLSYNKLAVVQVNQELAQPSAAQPSSAAASASAPPAAAAAR